MLFYVCVWLYEWSSINDYNFFSSVIFKLIWEIENVYENKIYIIYANIQHIFDFHMFFDDNEYFLKVIIIIILTDKYILNFMSF